ncbi:hypothetical protein GSI_04639 [Ganoderma sinense ZZ0214-1]|uniref:F-box domain-containing protein n=1 Tax=Ganoderma sinense ZZ0214-1 TaxID=1077348 RepID=A0A2G8SHE8_9APHY|nr:hypothetical protein GSI_04639 [Ganoderma sinense ZZ0214-1]
MVGLPLDDLTLQVERLLVSDDAIPPIHVLPAEILADIFEECWTGRNSLRISHVCRSWRSVLLDTKRFWVDAVKGDMFTPDDCSSGYMGASLERSAPHMLEPSLSRPLLSVFVCLVPHIGRVVSFNVTCVTNEVLFPLWTCLNSGMPCLATLTITLDDSDDCRWIKDAPIEHLFLWPAALPRLTQVSAPVWLFPSLSLPSLQHVALHNPIRCWYVGDHVEGDPFLTALEPCAPNLQTLALVSDAAPRLYGTATSPLALPALRQLRLESMARHCARLLEHVVLPRTVHIHCTPLDHGEGLLATDRVAMVGTHDAVSVHCYAGGEELLRVDTGLHHRSDSARLLILRPDDLVGFFGDRVRVTQLSVVGQMRTDMQGVAWCAFPHLVRAEIRGRKTMYAVKTLASKTHDEGSLGPAAAVCPRLRTLEIDHVLLAQPTDRLRVALRGGGKGEGITVIEADLRKRCIELEHVLSFRSKLGSRLTQLEFGCTEMGWEDRASDRRGILGPSSPDWTSWRPIVAPLEELVDGPVVFTGYRHLLDDA